MGLLINFPVLALAPGDAGGTTVIGASFARGLNDNSGKQSAFGAGFARGMERVSFGASSGYVATDLDELTLAARYAVHLLSDSPAQVSLQSGFGFNVALDFQRFDAGLEDVSGVMFSAGLHYVLS